MDRELWMLGKAKRPDVYEVQCLGRFPKPPHLQRETPSEHFFRRITCTIWLTEGNDDHRVKDSPSHESRRGPWFVVQVQKIVGRFVPTVPPRFLWP